MFVTDTVDAIYPPDAWLPQAIMDRLGEVLSDIQGNISSHMMPVNLSSQLYFDTNINLGRQPRLIVRRLTKISQLETFFSTISLASYEALYSAGTKVDWNVVEQSLERDIFDG